MNDSKSYLIAHLVRGFPAFDIAMRLPCAVCAGTKLKQVGIEEGFECAECNDDGYWWIIPTSGHQAYPYWTCQLMTQTEPILPNPTTPRHPFILLGADMEIPPPPPNWPDHYSTSTAPKGQGLGLNLASILNLIPKLTIRRR